jgi:uroporphyrinogen decarboxylase
MNCRERVLAAINKTSPDRTPVDFWAEPDVIERLIRDLKLSSERELLEYLQIDVRVIGAKKPADKVSGDIRTNFWGEVWKRIQHATGEEWLHNPGLLNQAQTIEDLKKFDWPGIDIFDHSVLPRQIEQNGGYAMRYGDGDIFTRPCCVRGMEQFLTDLALRPDMAHFIIDKFTEFYCEDLRRAIKASGGRIDIFMMYADLGSQLNPLIGRGMFEEFFKPYARKMFGIARDAGINAMLHSCGSVADFIPDLIEIGVNILNPIQVRAKNMEPAKLKAKFGQKMTFHGAVDEQEVLPNGSPEDVRREVRSRIHELGCNGGGYILCSTHMIQMDVPTENALAMYDTSLR